MILKILSNITRKNSLVIIFTSSTESERIMKMFYKTAIGILAAILVLCLIAPLTGCTEAERKSTQISREADDFRTPRKLTIINTRTDKVILEFIGTFSIQSSNGDGSIDILCAVSGDRYEKHFFALNEWTMYVVEDISNNGGDLYFREVKYYPENK